MTELNPISQVNAAEGNDERKTGERLEQSTVPQVREALALMDRLVPLLDSALKFATGEDSTDDQTRDVELMFGLFVGYFNIVDDALSFLSLANWLDKLIDGDAASDVD